MSTECRDLLARILVRDPERRLTLEGIQRHSFYTRDLPPNFFAVNQQLKAAPLPADLQVRYPALPPPARLPTPPEDPLLAAGLGPCWKPVAVRTCQRC